MQASLVINAGSSSLKFALFALPLAEGATPLFRGQIDGIGAQAQFKIKDAQDVTCLDSALPEADKADLEVAHQAALDKLLAWLKAQGVELLAVGHRVLHGGETYSAPVRLTPEVIDVLETFCPLGPLHQPHNLRPVKTLARLYPELPQVACFDTAFHRNQGWLAETFPLPRKLTNEGVKRYGFHGSSYEFVTRQLPSVLGADLARGSIVIAHLGNGASMAAVRDGRGVASTMGFTALDGLMMGTRTGNIDPGVLLYLMDRHGYGSKELTQLLYKESGLLGVSGISQDMRTLEASDKPEAAQAIDLFCYRAAREIGSLMMAAGGLDALVFTGGIGENSSTVRSKVMAYLDWMSASLDADANQQRGRALRIDAADSRVAVAVIPTNEEWMIAHHTAALLA